MLRGTVAAVLWSAAQLSSMLCVSKSQCSASSALTSTGGNLKDMNVADRRKTHTRIADNSVFDLLARLWWSENGYFNMLKSMVNP